MLDDQIKGNLWFRKSFVHSKLQFNENVCADLKIQIFERVLISGLAKEVLKVLNYDKIWMDLRIHNLSNGCWKQFNYIPVWTLQKVSLSCISNKFDFKSNKFQ